jgi:prophage antirepressor-like protein
MNNNHLAIFKGKKIRRVIYLNEWWFSVADICGALTSSIDSGAYWRKLKQRMIEESNQVVTFCHKLKLEASDGKNIPLIVPILRVYFVLFNLFPHQKPNRSNAG